MGFIALATLIIPLILLKHHRRPPKPRQLLDLTAFKEIPFLFATLAGIFIFAGLFVPYVFLSTFGLVKLHLSPDLAFYLTSILNAGSFAGRLIIGALATKYGPWRAYNSTVFVCALLILAWIGVHDLAGTLAFAVLYGFFSGGLVVVIGAVMPSLSPSLAVLGTRYGTMSGPPAFAELVGGPIASALGDVAGGDFLGIQLWGGCALVIAGVVLLVPHYLLAKKNK